MLAVSEKVRIFAPVKQKGRVAQLNRVADYGSAGYRFESCRGHTKALTYLVRALLFYSYLIIRIGVLEWKSIFRAMLGLNKRAKILRL